IPLGYKLNRMSISIPYGNEVRQQLALLIKHREVALMLAHRCNKHLLRNIQERCVKGASQRTWKFDEKKYFLQKILFDGNDPIMILHQLFDLLHDQLLAFCCIYNN